jgi:hypothetical protein
VWLEPQPEKSGADEVELGVALSRNGSFWPDESSSSAGDEFEDDGRQQKRPIGNKVKFASTGSSARV